MNKVLFAVIYNLLPGERENEELLKKIEEALMKVINFNWRSEIAEDEVAFSFPADFSVTSPEIPVVIDVMLFRSKCMPFHDSRGQEIADAIVDVFRHVLEKRENMLVIIKDTRQNLTFTAPC